NVRTERVERVRDECSHGFGRVSATLELGCRRVADLDHAGLVLGRADADVTDQSATLCLFDRELHPTAGFAGGSAGHLLDLRSDPIWIGPFPSLVAMDRGIGPVLRDRGRIVGLRS